MKYILASIITLILSAFTEFGGSTNYVIDISVSTIKWTGHAQTGVYSPSGTIKIKRGTIVCQDGQLTNAEIIIDMASIHQDNSEMETHLKGVDFFDIQKFPESIFVLKNFQGGRAEGELTVKGIKHRINFPCSLSKSQNQLFVKANISVDRTVYGIKYNSSSYFQDLGSYAIKNEFELAIDIKASAE